MRSTLILFITYILLDHSLFGQPCGPQGVLVDNEILLKNNNLLFLSFYNHHHSDVSMCAWYMSSSSGEVIFKKSYRLPTRGCQYNAFDCHCAEGQPLKNQNSYYGQCLERKIIPTENGIYIVAYLPGSYENCFLIKIDTLGSITHENINIRREYYYIPNDSVFKIRIAEFLHKSSSPEEQKFNWREENEQNVRPYFLKDFSRFKKRLLNKHKILMIKDSVSRTRYDLSYTWLITKKWKLLLKGKEILYKGQPINFTESKDFIYAVVHNFEEESCEGYGRDLYPVIYKIQKKDGVVLFESRLIDCW